ncbi:conserved oligomeric Golgi complex subunit 8 [Coccinella septempunctata]|uniref:conserved oligomeric Golgi complex subunit 8 n=1 Tax=Coccinella septempunctata TaxID=41139 RepID=UPI001D064214|nr:conserved oligomeric Golgi complex subunit 8 [Coccinella septempunctata]
MAAESKSLLQLIFPTGFPEEWNYNVKLDEYVKKLGGLKVEDLCKEVNDLQHQRKSILEHTQELAVCNYKTFIETAECSRKMFIQFNAIDEKLNDLLKDLPNFETKYEKFAVESSGINSLRKLNSLTLTKNAQLLGILELPQLMHSFIDDGLYDDALELTSYVRKLYAKHPDINIFKNVMEDVEKAWYSMLHQLLNQLRHELTLSKCLQIVGHLRRMDVFSETELRLKFLQTRNHYLQNCLKVIPNNDVDHHLNKVIEITRVNLFNIVTQYRAIFDDEDQNPLEILKSNHVNHNVIFFSWISEKISEFLTTLEDDLNKGVSSIDSVLGQCMYFGLSFSKVGCDFRALLVPIFTRRIGNDFQDMVHKATNNFEQNIEKFTLINKNHPNVPWKTKIEDPLQPPDSLLEFYPLAEYLNNILNAFNKLKLCAPMSLIDSITKVLQESLHSIAKSILKLYSQEQQAFSPGSKDAFTRLCMAFADDLIPFLQKCLHVIYPPTNTTSHLGINLQMVQKEGISFLDKSYIIACIKHLLPVRLETNLIIESKNVKSVEDDNSKSELKSEKPNEDISSNSDVNGQESVLQEENKVEPIAENERIVP